MRKSSKAPRLVTGNPAVSQDAILQALATLLGSQAVPAKPASAKPAMPANFVATLPALSFVYDASHKGKARHKATCKAHKGTFYVTYYAD